MPDTADIADIYRDFSVDVTPLASASVSSMDITSYPDLSVAASMSVDPGAYYADLGRDTSIRNPSQVLVMNETER